MHPGTWLGGPVRAIYAGLGADLDKIDDERPKDRFWERLPRVSDERLWDAHMEQKLELALFARGRLRGQFARHGEPPSELHDVESYLDPSILTIGFARRFATYKRAALLFSDEERLARLLWDEERPVQIVFAGKAHPADRPGQRVIQDIFSRSRSKRLKGRVVILEDYDIREGRYLVQGVDVWLNNPRRPLEASGTSGMKAAMNGVVNCSVLDGWWDEGWTGDNGWAIGGREMNPDEGAQDWADAQDLYRLLETEIVPTWYDRDPRGLPRRWTQIMRRSMATTIWRFSTARMLERVRGAVVPASGTRRDRGRHPAGRGRGRCRQRVARLTLRVGRTGHQRGRGPADLGGDRPGHPTRRSLSTATSTSPHARTPSPAGWPGTQSAAPAHDWNDRIALEAYAPNAELGNFGRIGWDLGPTRRPLAARAPPGAPRRDHGPGHSRQRDGPGLPPCDPAARLCARPPDRDPMGHPRCRAPDRLPAGRPVAAGGGGRLADAPDRRRGRHPLDHPGALAGG